MSNSSASGPPNGGGFAFDNAAKALESQDRRVDSIDTKAGVLLGATGVLAGFLVAGDSLLIRAPRCLGIEAAVALAIAGASALAAFWPRTYGLAPKPEAVIDDARADPSLTDDDLKWRFIENTREALVANRKPLRWKVVMLRVSGSALALGVLLTVTAVIWGLAKT